MKIVNELEKNTESEGKSDESLTDQNQTNMLFGLKLGNENLVFGVVIILIIGVILFFLCGNSSVKIAESSKRN